MRINTVFIGLSLTRTSLCQSDLLKVVGARSETVPVMEEI
jgi:hypothetical protein